MKVQFSLVTTYIPDWNKNRDLPEDEQITVSLKTLESMDMLELADALERQGVEGEVDSTKMTAKDIKSLLRETGRLLPNYATVKGLQGLDGPIGIEQVVTYPDFMELAVELLMQLANISQPNEDDIKN